MTLNEDYRKATSKVMDEKITELEQAVEYVRDRYWNMESRDYALASVYDFNDATNRVKTVATDLYNILRNAEYYYEEEIDE